jgi:KipI family sensor histidine kinase inhibitor
VLPYGDAAVLVEVDDPSDVVPLAESLARRDGVTEVVPAARTVLVHAQPHALAELRALPPDPAARPAAPAPAASVELAVRYDGPDLADVAAELGISEAEVVERHARAEYVVAFCGFAPGFAYLRGLDPALHVPRLAEPRTRVPAGSVGVAGEFTGVYPRVSPGGWRLLGRTDAPLWDLARTPPALLTPGTRVRFVPR